MKTAGLRRCMLRNTVKQHGISIRLACEVLDISVTCDRYQAKLSDENAEIADWLVREKLEPLMTVAGSLSCLYCVSAS